MRTTLMIVMLLTLLPNAARAQWGFDVSSVEAYINDHKKQRSLLLARSTLEYSNQLLHDYSQKETGEYKTLNVELDKYTRAFDVIDVMYQSLRTVLNVKSTYENVSERISDYKRLLEDFNRKVVKQTYSPCRHHAIIHQCQSHQANSSRWRTAIQECERFGAVCYRSGSLFHLRLDNGIGSSQQFVGQYREAFEQSLY